MKRTINIQNYYPSIIATRKAISILKAEISLIKGENYVFDFSNISFISRSFADELLKYIKTSDINWEFSNTNTNIQAILNAVKKSHENTRSDFDYVAITKFESDKEFNQFLTTF